MQSWQVFEDKCTEYLKSKFSAYASFASQGGSDSTVSDILVETKTGRVFYIEAKEERAQCGQFVLFPNKETRKFQYSKFNKTTLNEYSEDIIKYLNKHFDKFADVGTAGVDIDIPNAQEIFSNWIKTAYSEKRTRFFISKNFAIVTLADFDKAFSVTAKYRVKKSGSSPVPAKYVDKVSDYIKAHFASMRLAVLEKKLVAETKLSVDGVEIEIDGNNFMFSYKGGSRYEIRKLSNTYNANVIFSVKYVNDSYKLSDEKFIEELKS